MTTPITPTPPTSIIKTITTAIKNVVVSPLFPVILIALIAIAGMYIWSSAGKDDAMRTYTDKIKAYETSVVKPTLKRVDSLKLVIDSAKKIVDHTTVVAANQTVQIQVLKNNTKTLDARNKELEAKLGVLPDTAPTTELIHGLEKQVGTQDSTIKVLESRDSTRLKTIDGLKTEVGAYKTSNDSLVDVIKKWPMPVESKKLLGFIPTLTTKQAVITTAVISVIAGFKLHQAIQKK